MVDMAHFAGLVAGGQHPNPLPHAHVVTTTTHKTLRGPRGGMVLTNDEAIAKKINSADLPRPAGRPADARHRRQGGRLRRGAAPRVRRLRRAASVDNAQALAETLMRGRPRHRHRRHRHPPDAGRPAARRASPARTPRRRSAAPTSPATRTASRSTRSRRPSPRASASAPPPPPPAASAPPSSPRSAR